MTLPTLYQPETPVPGTVRVDFDVCNPTDRAVLALMLEEETERGVSWAHDSDWYFRHAIDGVVRTWCSPEAQDALLSFRNSVRAMAQMGAFH